DHGARARFELGPTARRPAGQPLELLAHGLRVRSGRRESLEVASRPRTLVAAADNGHQDDHDGNDGSENGYQANESPESLARRWAEPTRGSRSRLDGLLACDRTE